MKESEIVKVQSDLLDFLTGIHSNRNDSQKRKLDMWDRSFTLAYKDMSTHTVGYREEVRDLYFSGEDARRTYNRGLLYNAVKKYVMKAFDDLPINDPSDFNEWHIKACQHIVDIQENTREEYVVIGIKDQNNNTLDSFLYIRDIICHTDYDIKMVFTYGQAQKMINMMLKYLYIYYKCEGWAELDSLKEYFHVPIDRYVLEAAFGIDKFEDTPWSKIQDYKQYERCQAALKVCEATANFESPFMWELSGWPFEEERKLQIKLYKERKRRKKINEKM